MKARCWPRRVSATPSCGRSNGWTMTTSCSSYRAQTRRRGFTGRDLEWFQLVTLNVATKKATPMTFQVPGERTYNVIWGAYTLREVKGATTLFVPGLYVSRGLLPGLFKYDVAHGYTHLIAKGGHHRAQWLIDESGAIVGDFTYLLPIRHDPSLTTLRLGPVILAREPRSLSSRYLPPAASSAHQK
jgi:hypothetical protein